MFLEYWQQDSCILSPNPLTGKNCYCPAGFADYEINGHQVNGSWLIIIQGDTIFVPVKNIGANNYSKHAKHIRDNFTN